MNVPVVPAAAQNAVAEAEAANPLLGDWINDPLGVPPYDRIETAHYEPALRAALATARAEIEAIASNPAAPDFANVIEALERAGRASDKISAAFFNVAGADARDDIQDAQDVLVPLVTSFSNEMMLNPALFARIDALWQQRDSLDLTSEQRRLLEVTHERFTRAGAALDEASRARVAAINSELADLSTQFGRKLLADQKAGDVLLSEAEMAGVPADQRAAYAEAAKNAGKQGYLLAATRSVFEPFLTTAANRAAREKVFKAFDSRGANANDNNTSALISRMITLRAEKARLMGAGHHAEFALGNTMAKTPEAAMALLMEIYEPALARAREEEADLLKLAAADGITVLEPWDWRYYAEKLRQERYNFDDGKVKSYFPLDSMVAALKDTTEKLYGIRFVERPDLPVYAEGVRAWEIREANGDMIGLFFADWFARPTKRPGAWMNSLRSQSALFGDMPIVVNNTNFTKPAPGQPALISLDDAVTLFHEFGHGLHGLFSNVTYPSLSGTAVSRDFVEVPSQIHEHWVRHPEVLREHARNSAGEAIPEDLLTSLLEARMFNQGYLTVQQISSAILDMRIHLMTEIPEGFDAVQWEAEQLADLGVPRAVGMRHRLPHFSHIFAGGYSAGYYAYSWSEAMDADGFEAFKEAGDIFDPATAARLRREILSTGNSRDSEESYTAFRGRLPNADALLKNRGLK
ncbi:MAG: peptidase M3 [Erythrobacter sp. SCN 62-14]|nr:MAG: peptidase M3 [Erythrobacter sp. SCN 62-14]